MRSQSTSPSRRLDATFTAVAARLRRGRAEPMNQDARRDAAFQTVQLSLRQRQVLALLAAGMTDTEIASQLAISPRTARMHCDALRAKLGVPKRRLVPAAYRRLTGDDPPLWTGSTEPA